MIIILRLIDSCSKECEVTGEQLGGDYYYEIPLSMVHPGNVLWPKLRTPDHSVTIESVGSKSVTFKVRDVSGSVDGPYTIQVGEEKRSWYCFGEWSYGYEVTLVEADEKKFDWRLVLEEAKKSGSENDYVRAARLGSLEAYKWLIENDSSKYDREQWQKEAHKRGML